jgi:hypothetical protein
MVPVGRYAGFGAGRDRLAYDGPFAGQFRVGQPLSEHHMLFPKFDPTAKVEGASGLRLLRATGPTTDRRIR